MNKSHFFLPVLAGVLALSSFSPLAIALRAGDFSTPAVSEAVDADAASAMDWVTGSDVGLGGFLFPHLHAFGVFGDSTAETSGLATGHHDPQRSATLQSLEPGLSLRAGDYLQGFVTYSGVTDADGELDGEFEEAFLKLVNLPLDLELRGGRFLNRFGFNNARHSHGWDFVDQYLVNGRLLNEGELASIGGEVTWNLPTPWTSALSVSGGGLPAHEDEHHEEEGEEEPEFEAEGANLNAYVVGVNYHARYDYTDFHQFQGTLSSAVGENEFGRTTQVYGAGFEYLWRENGYEPGGRSLGWRTEVMYRNSQVASGHGHGHEEEEEEHGHEEDHHEDDQDGEHPEEEEERRASFDEVGASTQVLYGFNDNFVASLRGEFVSGVHEMGLDERWRVSPAVTWYANPQRTLQARLQYNYDYSNDFGEEHSLWFQVGLNWGGPEVR